MSEELKSECLKEGKVIYHKGLQEVKRHEKPKPEDTSWDQWTWINQSSSETSESVMVLLYGDRDKKKEEF